MSDDESSTEPEESESEGESQDVQGSCDGGSDSVKKYGCEHYKCRCAYIAPCCENLYVCRLCHDEKETHEMNRFDVTQIVCLMCGEEQQVQNECQECGVGFGNYFCSLCRLFDDTDKKQFHCHACGLCRVGGRENFFHCDRCDMCLSVSLKYGHKCVEKVTRANCPVCMEDLHTSVKNLHILNCGHVCHRDCFMEMLKSGTYACPLCCHAMIDMSAVWSGIDREIEETPMPEEYQDAKNWVLCRDCHKECETKFHVFGMKCLHCGSYNTCGTSRPDSESPQEGGQ